jgi:hypothetical protein
MSRTAITLTALLAAVVLAATALGGPPAPLLGRVNYTHVQPVAGSAFTGVAITPEDAGIQHVYCPGHVRGHDLHGWTQRYYLGGLGVVTCTWRIPASARGVLTTQVTVITTKGTLNTSTPPWHIRP